MKRKIRPKTVDDVFIGYALDRNANRFFVTNSEINGISNNTIIEVVMQYILIISFLLKLEFLVSFPLLTLFHVVLPFLLTVILS